MLLPTAATPCPVHSPGQASALRARGASPWSMFVQDWVAQQGGIAHREAAAGAGFGVAAVRAAARAGDLRIVRRRWVAVPWAAGPEVTAAAAGGLVACVSAARVRGWWLPDHVEPLLHLRLAPHAASDGLSGFDGVAHWTEAVAPAARYSLVESIEDALAHVATCLAPEDALVVWESAIRRERLDLSAVRQVRWPSLAARACAEAVRGLSDSGLETIFSSRLQHWGIRIRPQAHVGGRRVDFLFGDRLVVQIDGYEHHSSAAQRGRDVAHDAELRLRGFTVLRFTYAQVVHDWASVERTIARAIAAGLHLAA